ncbi:response regulator [bacterium]|nr:response regulator [bacterium]
MSLRKFSQQNLTCPRDYMRSVGLDGLRPLVIAAAFYFAFATVVVVMTAPQRFLYLLVAQKITFILGAIFFARHLSARRFPVQRFDLYASVLLVACLISGLCTAAAGLSGPFGVYCTVMLLGVAFAEISWKRSILSWVLVWLCWLAVFHSLPFSELLAEVTKLVGIQLVAITAMALRLRISVRQFNLVRDLGAALEESETMRRTLDSRVEQRTAELHAAHQDQQKLQDQLTQSQKMESLGRLAGGVAHDFNNLLTVIMGNLELIRTCTPEQSESSEYIDDAESAAKRAAEVTGHLLAFSRKEVLKMRPIKLQKLLQDSLKMVHRLIGEDIQLISHLNCPNAQVEGDNMRLQQVLLNLVVNARDAMPSGGKLTISLDYGQPDELVWTVSDTGCGMSKATAARIFEPFYTTKPLGEGTGLGLSTVHGIVSMHSGKISVSSRPGQGSTFTLSLPCLNPNGSESLSGSNQPLPKTASGRLLLVEDDDQVRALTSRLLRLFGYDVQAFANGNKALSWLSEHRPCDLLITDAVMPEMDGGRLAQSAQELRPELPVLFISGYTDDRLAPFGIDRGEANFLAKPFTPAQLQNQVAGILKNCSHSGP